VPFPDGTPRKHAADWAYPTRKHPIKHVLANVEPCPMDPHASPEDVAAVKSMLREAGIRPKQPRRMAVSRG
jgi:hypothetical protein